ncbi:MAG: TonB C-terminal domain-containing protein [Gemmatimonadaceae bacterium]|nr:TonB C-terminal domain-containing protein [Gemmatimonadaceae bacterium]
MTGATAAPRPPAARDGARPPLTARTAALWSVSAHLAVLVAMFALTRVSLPPAMPPAYSVELVAAPAGPRALGAVQEGPPAVETPPPAIEEPSPAVTPPEARPTLDAARPAPARRPAVKPTPAARPAPPKAGGATPVPGTTPAGGGPTGGRGRDVASVKVQGIAFPFPGYLENITRQIALNFKPRPGSALRAEVSFLVNRDGSVSDLRLVSRSGVYAFDLECIGAVEAVGQRRSFGALPAGFREDVLPVVFSFDPTVLR